MKRSAFTLIELLVVIAIIAILAAILFPVYSRAKASAKNIKEVVQAREIGMAVSMYLIDYDDTMPIFYAYNSDPPAGVEGHKGVEVLLFPYSKSEPIFLSPNDMGGPYTGVDVPGTTSYWQAYGSSYRFTQCMFSILAGESSQNNELYDFSSIVTSTMIQFPAESRIMRVEMFPFFSRKFDTDCSRYYYDCDPPYNYYRTWSDIGGTVIYADSHAKFITGPGQFDAQYVSPDAHRSGDENPDSWTGDWYGVCD